jgi:hypothetical protein
VLTLLRRRLRPLRRQKRLRVGRERLAAAAGCRHKRLVRHGLAANLLQAGGMRSSMHASGELCSCARVAVGSNRTMSARLRAGGKGTVAHHHAPAPLPCRPRTHRCGTWAARPASCPSRAAHSRPFWCRWCKCCAACPLAAAAGCCTAPPPSHPCRRLRPTGSRRCCRRRSWRGVHQDGGGPGNTAAAPDGGEEGVGTHHNACMQRGRRARHNVLQNAFAPVCMPAPHARVHLMLAFAAPSLQWKGLSLSALPGFLVRRSIRIQAST